MFARSTLCKPFGIFTRVGHHLVEARGSGTISNLISSVLVVEESSGDEGDVISFFSEQVFQFFTAGIIFHVVMIIM